MANVRAGVDAIDLAMVDLLALRFADMRAAARINNERSSVRDEARKRQFLDNVVATARQKNAPALLAERLWEQLIKASTAFELVSWDEMRG